MITRKQLEEGLRREQGHEMWTAKLDGYSVYILMLDTDVYLYDVLPKEAGIDSEYGVATSKDDAIRYSVELINGMENAK